MGLRSSPRESPSSFPESRCAARQDCARSVCPGRPLSQAGSDRKDQMNRSARSRCSARGMEGYRRGRFSDCRWCRLDRPRSTRPWRGSRWLQLPQSRRSSERRSPRWERGTPLATGPRSGSAVASSAESTPQRWAARTAPPRSPAAAFVDLPKPASRSPFDPRAP